MLSTCPSVCACSGGGSFPDRFAVDFSFICCDEYLLIFFKINFKLWNKRKTAMFTDKVTSE